MAFRVLVADDSQPMRRLVCRYLEAVGVPRPIEAVDGDEAWALFKPSGFDLIITDWHMPGKAGADLIRALRQADPRVAIVLMTTEADDDKVSAGLAAGANSYLAKPFDAGARAKLLAICRTLNFESAGQA